MIKLFFILFIISDSTFAYELINFSSTQVRSIEDILTETQIDEKLLDKFRCDDESRYELFSYAPLQNMAKDSLKILSRNGVVYTYDNEKLFDINNIQVSKIKDNFLKTALKSLKRLSTSAETKQLIEELQFSPYPFYISLGGNRYAPNAPGERTGIHGNNAGFISMMDELRPMVDRMPFDRIGYGGFIYWNPQTKARFIESDYIERQVDTDLILAHEMYHAYDGMRGLLDRRFVKSIGSEDLEFQPVCEYRAVRLENITRKNLGFKYRRYYTRSSDDSKDMLDEYDEPEVMPTPCIHWL